MKRKTLPSHDGYFTNSPDLL